MCAALLSDQESPTSHRRPHRCGEALVHVGRWTIGFFNVTRRVSAYSSVTMFVAGDVTTSCAPPVLIEGGLNISMQGGLAYGSRGVMISSHSPPDAPSCRGCTQRRSRAGPVNHQAFDDLGGLSLVASQRRGPRTRTQFTMINAELESHTLAAHLILRAGSPPAGCPPSRVAFFRSPPPDSGANLGSTTPTMRPGITQSRAAKLTSCLRPIGGHARKGGLRGGCNVISSQIRLVSRGSPVFSAPLYHGAHCPHSYSHAAMRTARGDPQYSLGYWGRSSLHPREQPAHIMTGRRSGPVYANWHEVLRVP